ncbi:response regulator transcription factor [Streptosporangium sandarakinum]|uniref:response regulator transcription factor n=1 Tax=Streptosporangium sandarakinum TaxID=1260955 RepID=UPI00371678CF
MDITEREREVLVLVARGLSDAEIAQTLYVTLSTVKTHVGNLLLKLDARTRVHLVIAAYEANLVQSLSTSIHDTPLTGSGTVPGAPDTARPGRGASGTRPS